MGFLWKAPFFYHQTFILKIKGNDRIVIAESVGEEKQKLFFFNFRFGLGKIGQQVKARILQLLANPRRERCQRRTLQVRSILEMKMFLSQILYERHHIDEKCRLGCVSAFIIRHGFRSFSENFYSVESRIWQLIDFFKIQLEPLTGKDKKPPKI